MSEDGSSGTWILGVMFSAAFLFLLMLMLGLIVSPFGVVPIVIQIVFLLLFNYTFYNKEDLEEGFGFFVFANVVVWFGFMVVFIPTYSLIMKILEVAYKDLHDVIWEEAFADFMYHLGLFMTWLIGPAIVVCAIVGALYLLYSILKVKNNDPDAKV